MDQINDAVMNKLQSKITEGVVQQVLKRFGNEGSSTGNNEELETVVRATMAGASVAELQGISKEDMESLYGVAYDFYEQGKLSEAEKFFRFLCIYDFYNADYLMGLAAVYHMQKAYQKATDTYTLAYMQAPHDLRPVFHIGQCALALGEKDKAKEAFEIVVQEADPTELGELKVKAAAYLAAIKKSLN